MRITGRTLGFFGNQLAQTSTLPGLAGYFAERDRVGHELFDIIELDLDYCSLTEGVPPCTSTATGDNKCYNTISTTNDIANYTKEIKTYKFCSRSHAPIGFGMFNTIESIKMNPARVEPGELGVRGTLTIKLRDFPHHDRGIDKSVGDRTYIPIAQGTYWGKLLARNPYYFGRELRYRKGYYTDPFSLDNFQTRTYIIEEISGPDAKGMITIKAKDRLKLADGERVQIPALSQGTLDSAITGSPSTFTFTAGDGAGYPASGTFAIGDENIKGTRSGDVVTIIERGADGTEQSDHDAGSAVQECKVWSSENAVDILHEILTDYVGIDESNIPYDAGLASPTGTNDMWDDEKDNWLGLNILSRTVREPTGARDLIDEALEQNNLMLWHDIVSDLIMLKANVPPLANVALSTLTDQSSLIMDSIDPSAEEKRRISTLFIYYNKIDNSESDKAGNYANALIFTDPAKEGPDQYGVPKYKIIFANWLTSEAMALQLGGRLLSRYSISPVSFKFSLAGKDSDLELGDFADIATHALQATDGSNKTQRIQIIERADDGDLFKYRALSSSFSGLYGFIGPNTLGDRTSESEENKQKYAFIAPDSGTFANGDPAYKII